MVFRSLDTQLESNQSLKGTAGLCMASYAHERPRKPVILGSRHHHCRPQNGPRGESSLPAPTNGEISKIAPSHPGLVVPGDFLLTIKRSFRAPQATHTASGTSCQPLLLRSPEVVRKHIFAVSEGGRGVEVFSRESNVE